MSFPRSVFWSLGNCSRLRFSHLLCELCGPVDNPFWPAGSAGARRYRQILSLPHLCPNDSDARGFAPITPHKRRRVESSVAAGFVNAGRLSVYSAGSVRGSGSESPCDQADTTLQRASSRSRASRPLMVRVVGSSADIHFKRSPRFPQLPQAPFFTDRPQLDLAATILAIRHGKHSHQETQRTCLALQRRP